jgi:hypothetical protein
MLVFIKFIMALLTDTQPREALENTIAEEEKKEDPLEKVKVFTEGMQKIITKK